MNKLNKCILLFIMLFLNTTYLFADIGNRGRWDNGGTSNFGMSLWVLLGIIAGGFFACIFIKNGLENGFKDKELNKTGCMSIIATIVGLLVLVSMCSHLIEVCMKFKFLAFILIAFSINLYADEYKFDYAVIDNEKVTTVSASNITAHLISESKATVTYKNETVTLISKDGYEYKGFGESGVVIVSNRVNGVLSRITIGGTFRGQTVILVYKRINSK